LLDKTKCVCSDNVTLTLGTWIEKVRNAYGISQQIYSRLLLIFKGRYVFA